MNRALVTMQSMVRNSINQYLMVSRYSFCSSDNEQHIKIDVGRLATPPKLGWYQA
jgi:hypothetical protein